MLRTHKVYLDSYTFMQSHGFCPNILKPTLVTNVYFSFIYQILVKNPIDVVVSGQIFYEVSDHYPVIAVISLPKSVNNDTQK